jgi:hypothetical protein
MAVPPQLPAIPSLPGRLGLFERRVEQQKESTAGQVVQLIAHRR